MTLRVWMSVLVALLVVGGSSSFAQQITPAGSGPPAYDAPPVLVHEELGQYTAAARSANVSGKVIVELTVDVHGQAINVHLFHGLGHGLDIAAIVAVRRDRFKPAIKDGETVEATIRLEVPFDPAVNPGP